MKAWRSIDKSEIEKPLRPEERSGVCGVDEEDGLSMETEAEDEEKEGGKEVIRESMMIG